jgi:hypothetical protein
VKKLEALEAEYYAAGGVKGGSRPASSPTF